MGDLKALQTLELLINFEMGYYDNKTRQKNARSKFQSILGRREMIVLLNSPCNRNI